MVNDDDERIEMGQAAFEQRRTTFEAQSVEYQGQLADPNYVPYPGELAEGQLRQMAPPVAPKPFEEAKTRKKLQMARKNADQAVKAICQRIMADLST